MECPTYTGKRKAALEGALVVIGSVLIISIRKGELCHACEVFIAVGFMGLNGFE
jgi:hypothetical protein